MKINWCTDFQSKNGFLLTKTKFSAIFEINWGFLKFYLTYLIRAPDCQSWQIDWIWSVWGVSLWTRFTSDPLPRSDHPQCFEAAAGSKSRKCQALLSMSRPFRFPCQRAPLLYYKVFWAGPGGGAEEGGVGYKVWSTKGPVPPDVSEAREKTDAEGNCCGRMSATQVWHCWVWRVNSLSQIFKLLMKEANRWTQECKGINSNIAATSGYFHCRSICGI